LFLFLFFFLFFFYYFIVKLPEVNYIEEEGKVEATEERTISIELLSIPLSATYVVFDE